MRKSSFIPIFCLLLSGCGTHESLPAQEPADVVRVTTLAGLPGLPLKDIREKERAAALVSFVNSLPSRWSVPWYGPQIGWVYFEFYGKRGASAGTFCVGPGFFGRVAGKSYSEGASRGEIEELGKIIGMDLWAYLTTNEPVQKQEQTVAPITPIPRVTPIPHPTPTPHPTPAAVAPTRHP